MLPLLCRLWEWISPNRCSNLLPSAALLLYIAFSIGRGWHCANAGGNGLGDQTIAKDAKCCGGFCDRRHLEP